METLTFYIFLFIHLVSLIIGFGAVIVVDSFGLLWVLKKAKLHTVDKVATITQKLIWIGWGGLVLSGIGLISFKGYIDNLTWIKLFFVALLGLNGLYLHIIKRGIVSFLDGKPISDLFRFRIVLASVVSQVGWWGAIIIGFLHRQWSHTINWPQNPALYIGLIAAAIFLIALVGELKLKNK
jgi:hypothetical protein